MQAQASVVIPAWPSPSGPDSPVPETPMFPSRLKLASYALVVLLGCLIAACNLVTTPLTNLPAWVPKPHVTLGLDLRGGSHLVLAVDAAGLARDRLEAIAADAGTALKEAGIAGADVSVSGDAVVVRPANTMDGTAVEAARRGIVSTVTTQGVSTSQPDIEISRGAAAEFLLRPTAAALDALMQRAVAQSIPIVERRINEVGVVEPTVQRLGTDRILVQLPGVQNPDEIKKLLGTTAKMTFHLVVTKPEPAALEGGALPPGVIMAPAAKGDGHYPIVADPLLQGDRLTDAAM